MRLLFCLGIGIGGRSIGCSTTSLFYLILLIKILPLFGFGTVPGVFIDVFYYSTKILFPGSYDYESVYPFG
jgi:hypothetical protein